MSILVRFTPAGEPMTTDQYDETVRRLEESGDFPADGMQTHVCFSSEGRLRVSEVWESQAKFEAFGERLMPVLADVGIDPGEPEICEIHNMARG